MRKTLLESIIENLKEEEEYTNECFACGRPTTDDDYDDLDKPVCKECYSYITELVRHGEWIEEEYGEKANYKDFEDFCPDWRLYFKDLEPDKIPFDKLTDEAYDIYLKE